MTKKRLFLGIPPDPPILKEAEAIQQAVKLDVRYGSSVRWLPREQLHLTLLFLGSVDEEFIPKITNRLGVLPFEIHMQEFNKVVLFPYPLRATTLGIGNPKASIELQRLWEYVKLACTNIGLTVEKRPFFPHMTLARFKPSIRFSAPWADNWDIKLRLRVWRVVLYESHLEKKGSRYEIIAEFPLAAPSSA